MNGAGHRQHGAPGSFPTRKRETGVSRGPQLRFPHTARLLQHAAFDRVYREGRRIFSGNMTVFYRPRPEGEAPAGPRIGFTVSRAMGGAVRRNRIRRRLREAVRLHLGAFTSRVDVVINPKRTTVDAEFTALETEVERAFGQIGRACPSSAGETATAFSPHGGKPA